MRLFHTTDAGEAVVSGSVQDATGSYGLLRSTLTGVFLADVPLDINEGATGDDVLAVELPDDLDLTDFEIVDRSGMSGYREWCIPATLLNKRGTVRLLTEEEGWLARWRAAAPQQITAPTASRVSIDTPSCTSRLSATPPGVGENPCQIRTSAHPVSATRAVTD